MLMNWLSSRQLISRLAELVHCFYRAYFELRKRREVT